MSTTPFMQLYVGDYLADTLHLTTEQHGAYLLLLMTMWRAGAALPNDPAKLARISRVSPKRWPAIWAEIEGFFVVEGAVITNKRLTKEHQKAVSISQERKTAGKKGAEAKALKNNNAAQANAQAELKHSQKPEPEPEREEDGGGGSAGARDADPQMDQTSRERLLSAMGVDPISGMTGRGGSRIGTQADMAEVGRWLALPGMSFDAALAEVERMMACKPDGPPSSFRYFTPAMQRLSGALSAAPLAPDHAGGATATARASPPRRLWTLNPDDFNPDGSLRQ